MARTREVARYLGCSQRSIQAMNLRLAAMGFIEFTKKGFGFLVRLINKDGWLTAKSNKDQERKKGEGYVKRAFVRHYSRQRSIKRIQENFHLLGMPADSLPDLIALVKKGKIYWDSDERNIKSVNASTIPASALSLSQGLRLFFERQTALFKAKRNKTPFKATPEAVSHQLTELDGVFEHLKFSIQKWVAHTNDETVHEIIAACRKRVEVGAVKGIRGYLKAIIRSLNVRLQRECAVLERTAITQHQAAIEAEKQRMIDNPPRKSTDHATAKSTFDFCRRLLGGNA